MRPDTYATQLSRASQLVGHKVTSVRSRRNTCQFGGPNSRTLSNLKCYQFFYFIGLQEYKSRWWRNGWLEVMRSCSSISETVKWFILGVTLNFRCNGTLELRKCNIYACFGEQPDSMQLSPSENITFTIAKKLHAFYGTRGLLDQLASGPYPHRDESALHTLRSLCILMSP